MKWNSTTWIAHRSLHRNLDYNMAQQYLAVKARNLVTGQTVINKDLSGARLELRQRKLAETQAQQLAERMSRNTGETWRALVEVYTANSL